MKKIITLAVTAAALAGGAFSWFQPMTASASSTAPAGIVVEHGIFPICGPDECEMTWALRVQPADPQLAMVFVKASATVRKACAMNDFYPTCKKS